MRKSLTIVVPVVVGLLSFQPAAAAERQFTLDPGATEATFTLDTTLHLVHGSLSVVSGEIRFDTATGAASGEILLDATATDTGNDGRDKKMHRRVLESATFPTIVFRPTGVEGSLDDADSGLLDLRGELTIHGDTHPLVLHILVDASGDRVTGTTAFTVPYVEWGMYNPSLFILRVSKEVEVSIVAVGELE